MNIPEHITWQITDSTKLNCFLDCPRKYFYEYVLGWSPDRPRHDLEFGEAWHQAQEYLLLNGYNQATVEGAMVEFLRHYRKFFSEDTDMDYAPKNPGYALTGLLSYIQQYAADRHDFEVLYTEIAGSVPVSKNQLIYFRMDAVCKDLRTGQVFALEHKTTKSDQRQWNDQWPLAIQLGTYTHVLYCLYNQEEVYGVKVNGSIFTKTKGVRHVRIPIRKTKDAMNAWHFDVAYWLDLLHEQFDMLLKAKEDDQVMEAFPRNPGACTKYFGCAYHDFCTAWANPLRRCDTIPEGFVEYRWNPAEREAKFKVEL